MYQGSMKIMGQEVYNPEIRVAMTDQEPLVFSDTVRNNIVFGLEFDMKLYRKVLHVTCLEKDIAQWSEGDQTLIGEKGSTLSGGQRSRIALGRALYSLADIYLLDDPLSGLDSSVMSNVFEQGIKDFIFNYQVGLKRNSIRPIVIMVTHQIDYALKCDQTIVLNKGRLSAYGTFNNIKDKMNMVAHRLVHSLAKQCDEEEEEEELK